MENSNILKLAKSDIFKELQPIINFYIKRGAKPNALKKYYKNKKRFNDILDDIKNKGINLVKDETEYHKLVKEILDDILDDFISKEKDEEYTKKQKNLKHIKEFNSYNEDLSNWMIIGAGLFTGMFIRGLVKDLIKKRKIKNRISKYASMTPKEQSEYMTNLDNRRNEIYFEMLYSYIGEFFRRTGEIEIIDSYVWYIFKLDDLIIKIHKFDKSMKWSKIEFKGTLNNYYIPDPNNFVKPIQLTDEDIQELKTSLEKDKKEMEE